MMDNLVVEYDPTKPHTDISFFDGASNVAKAGLVLQAKFPSSYSLHSGEHVVSLFFDDISKFPPIKVTFAVHLFLLLDFSLDLISLPHSHIYLRHSLQRPTDFTIYLGPEHLMGSMHSSWHSPH
jgi:hypothetical protein